jgi:thiol-disulfide isomerase/thioredoxin
MKQRIFNVCTTAYIIFALSVVYISLAPIETFSLENSYIETKVPPRSLLFDHERQDYQDYTVRVWTASWCGPCKRYKTEEIPTLVKAGYTVEVLDIDDEEAKPNYVKKIPLVELLYKGKTLKRKTYWRAEDITDFVSKHQQKKRVTMADIDSTASNTLNFADTAETTYTSTLDRPLIYRVGQIKRMTEGSTLNPDVIPDTTAPVEFPDWTTNGKQWDDTQAALLSSITANQFLSGVTNELFGTVAAGTNKYIGGVLAPNNSIYCLPYTATNVLKIDTVNDTLSTIGTLSGSAKWYGGVLTPSGNIYAVPQNSTSILKINTNNDNVTTFGSLSGTAKWAGGRLAFDGVFIYCAPYNSSTILKIDTVNDTTSTFGTLGATGGKWAGITTVPSGNMVCIPFNSTAILKVYTHNDSTATFGSLTGSSKWAGGVLAANGLIYAIPNVSTSPLVINPDEDIFAFIGHTLTATAKGSGGILSPDGLAHSAPLVINKRLTISPYTDGTGLAFVNAIDSSTYKWRDLVLAPNGHAYGIPSDATEIYKLVSPLGPISSNFCLSRFYNGF